MQSTPISNRIHISFFGKTNTGKSSLINTITGQDISLVSDISGTTTDIVYKTMEINKIGPCVLIDTPGFDDKSILGDKRIKLTQKVLLKTDIAILLICDENFDEEKKWIEKLKEKSIPTIIVINKSDILETTQLSEKIKNEFNQNPIIVSSKENIGIEEIYLQLINIGKSIVDEISLCSHLVSNDDLVLLVVPQDIQAPKGRLILPQVQMIRELLDNKCIVICINTEQLEYTISIMNKQPKLIITDSQVIGKVYSQKPKETLITTFSILFSRYKGDISTFIKDANTIDTLNENSKILIAESCTHKPIEEDIGRVKLPRLLRKKIHKNISIDICSGNDFPEDISKYDLIIHCGACMFNRSHVLSRINIAKKSGIPITNYGIAISKLTNTTDSIELSGLLK